MTTSRRLRTDRLENSRLYLCTDARRERGDLIDFVAAAVDGGVDLVQLRDKGSVGESRFGTLEAREELEILARLRAVTQDRGALLAVNDRADISTLADADVLHVGQGDLSAAQARQIVGPEILIGQSTHDVEQMAVAVADDELDYFCVGPCWPTPTKPGRSAPGLDLVRATAAAGARTPWFAIGGIDADRMPEVAAAGARRAVVVRAITAADDPTAAAIRLRALLSGHQVSR
ncbi:thiamine phosphate synthase [Gordonia sp. ABSL11-1]|uniref:thiamine phosphate synthase n=1 Tax=Gordonia sp. ABSL11-1 TaxID=3053924 RepID=UPI002573D70F|nr:thiamine phosphate synthase [Gordonia sp. ABSL11-1]MDL9946284.1 thiamine phosphate synthase [Gordonia sp. ABSL11-1]